MTRLFYVTFIFLALTTFPALARGGFAVAPMVRPNSAHPKPHAGSPVEHGVAVTSFKGHQPNNDGFRRRGPIVIVVGGSYVQQHDAYCAQNYPDYDPASETYLDEDGERYLCPELPE